MLPLIFHCYIFLFNLFSCSFWSWIYPYWTNNIPTPPCTHTIRYFFFHFRSQTESWFYCEISILLFWVLLIHNKITISLFNMFCCVILLYINNLLHNGIVIPLCEISHFRLVFFFFGEKNVQRNCDFIIHIVQWNHTFVVQSYFNSPYTIKSWFYCLFFPLPEKHYII